LTIWVRFLPGEDVVFFTVASWPAVGSTQPLMSLKQPKRESLYSSMSSSEMNAWSNTSTHPYIFIGWCLFKNKNNFTFNFTSRRPSSKTQRNA